VETLHLSDSTPQTESRIKVLFWPSIQSGSDVDYLGAQGYWICTLVAVLSAVFLVLLGEPISGAVVFVFYYLGGVGVREGSRYAATIIFAVFLADMLVYGVGIVRVLIGGLLLSNVRATWIAARWKPADEAAVLPPRLSETWADKFSDKLPEWLWPKLRVPYYIFSASLLALIIAGLLLARFQT
jgi:hypothetical protein